MREIESVAEMCEELNCLYETKKAIEFFTHLGNKGPPDPERQKVKQLSGLCPRCPRYPKKAKTDIWALFHLPAGHSVPVHIKCVKVANSSTKYS